MRRYQSDPRCRLLAYTGNRLADDFAPADGDGKAPVLFGITQGRDDGLFSR